MIRRRRLWSLGLTFTLLVLGGLVLGVYPYTLLSGAEEALDADPCAFGGRAGQDLPPTEAFFTALRDLETASGFPGFEEAADDLASAAAARCVGSFSIACQELKYAAQDAETAAMREKGESPYDKDDPDGWRRHLPRDVRLGFCAAWRPFSDYAAAAGADVARLCPPCAY